jgi:glycosyltransferase involved in cell wall biosynthesis
MKLSLAIPCYNESDGIDQLRTQLDAARPGLDRYLPWELVLIDDGSTDDRGVRRLAEPADRPPREEPRPWRRTADRLRQCHRRRNRLYR